MTCIIRAPTRPHYKEEEYIQSKVVLKYTGHTDQKTERSPGEESIWKNWPQDLFLGWCDEVTVLQQPRGSYTLEVFNGNMAVGGKSLQLGLLVLNYFCS